MSFVQRFTRNMHGRDFVVGDVHGCFETLRSLLHRVSFDPTKDRLFFTGDLVDRGPRSMEALEWLEKTWVHAVRGNHEQMAIGVAAGKHDWGNYLRNGGAWFLVLDDEVQQAIARVFSNLPIAIEIETPTGLVGIVHAEPLSSWTDMVAQLACSTELSKTRVKNLLEKCLWSRTRIENNDTSVVEGVSRVYVGHAAATTVRRLGNVDYIDTGCGKGGQLTIVALNEPDHYITI